MKLKTATKTIKRPDSNRTIQNKAITIERKQTRLNIARLGGRF